MSTLSDGMRPGLLGLVLCCALLQAACGPPASQPPPASRPNVLLISIDTLRADHLGCYGHDKPVTPRIDRFRSDAVLFSQAFAHGPSTLISHASMLTSLLPPQHGASFSARTRLAPEVTTLAEVLQQAGYRTASFNGGGQIDAVWGLDQGFERYESTTHESFWYSIKPALPWIEQLDDEPFFLFLHTYEVHHPYRPGREYLARLSRGYSGPLPPDQIAFGLMVCINQGLVDVDIDDLDHIENTYDAEILSMDEMFGNLMDWLKQQGLYEDSLIVLTSDHGEEFGEHGEVGMHSHTLYDELLHVPLIVKLPGNQLAGAEVSAQVRSIDIASTLLEVVGLEAPPSFQGRSLLAHARGESFEELPVVAQKDHKNVAIVALRENGWKLFDREVYDLLEDPGEQRNLAPRQPARLADLRARVEELIGAAAMVGAPSVELDEAAIERLRALGYLQ